MENNFTSKCPNKNLDGSEFKCNFQHLLKRLDDPTYPEGDGDTDPMEDDSSFDSNFQLPI